MSVSGWWWASGGDIANTDCWQTLATANHCQACLGSGLLPFSLLCLRPRCSLLLTTHDTHHTSRGSRGVMWRNIILTFAPIFNRFHCYTRTSSEWVAFRETVNVYGRYTRYMLCLMKGILSLEAVQCQRIMDVRLNSIFVDISLHQRILER